MRHKMITLAALALATCSPAPASAGPVTQPAAGGGTSYTPGAPAYASGFWYNSTPSTAQAGTAGSAGYVFLEPFGAAQSITIDKVGVLVATAGATGSKATIYVYGSNTAGNRPSGSPLGQCEITTVTSTGFQSCTFSTSVALTGNKVYWFGWEINSTATALVAMTPIAAAGYEAWLAGYTDPIGLASTGSALSRVNLQFGNASHTYGAASNPATYSPAMIETYGQVKIPAVLFHVASVP